MFAGLVILVRDTFRRGDQIAVSDVSGTVVSIDLTATRVRTFHGRLVLIPNSIIHSNIVTVQTGYEQVATSVAVDLSEDVDFDRARDVALQTMNDVAAVLDDPAPQALWQEIGSGTVRMELRFWSGARQLETREARHAVIQAVLEAFRAAGVATGSDTHVVRIVGESPVEPPA